MLASLPSADLLGTPSELWVMFNSPAVTAADPHGKLDFFFFVRIALVQVRRRTSAALVCRGNSVTCCSEASPSLTDKSSQTGLFLRADGRTEWSRYVQPHLVYSQHAITALTWTDNTLLTPVCPRFFIMFAKIDHKKKSRAEDEREFSKLTHTQDTQTYKVNLVPLSLCVGHHLIYKSFFIHPFLNNNVWHDKCFGWKGQTSPDSVVPFNSTQLFNILQLIVLGFFSSTSHPVAGSC